MAYYKERISQLSKIIDNLQRRSRLISNTRLILFLLVVFLVYMIWNMSTIILLLIIAFGFFLFIYLVQKSKQTEIALVFQKTLFTINQEEVLSLEGKFQNRPDGSSYISEWGLDNDLDRFGKNSLYQLINRAESQRGHEAIARSLTSVIDIQQLQTRQGAIKELQAQVDWRQNFRSHCIQNQITFQSQDILRQWISASQQASVPGIWKLLSYILPLSSLTMAIGYGFDFIPRVFFYSYLILAFIIAVYFGKVANEWFKHLTRIVNELNTLLPSIKLIEKLSVTNSLLKEIQLKVTAPVQTSTSLKQLSQILARYDFRLNPVVYIPLNFFLWWDLRQLLALYKWRKSHQGNTDHWFEVIAQMEELSSYANLAFNQPTWVFPNLSNHWHEFNAKDLGHPLIPSGKAVTNDFSLNDPHRIALITGSNMAGKSTFLRSIGANVLIGMAGGPVFASSFTLSPCLILTSMRISDNLQEETSTFYAELKKIKIILDAVKQHSPVMVLIDEMLRGTNTLDRELGSKALVRQLIRYNAVAVIASHDTGLGAIQLDHPETVDNYYFDSIIDGENIRFDYKMKPGICTQTNASYLMKKMGIDVN